MNTEKLNVRLSLVANLGVVAALALLIYEVHQATKLAETEAFVNRLSEIQQAYVEFATSDYLPAVRVKAVTEGVQSLSAVELSRLQYWEGAVRMRMASQYHQFQHGYLDQATADDIVNAAVGNLKLWEQLGFEIGDSEFGLAIRAAAGR